MTRSVRLNNRHKKYRNRISQYRETLSTAERWRDQRSFRKEGLEDHVRDAYVQGSCDGEMFGKRVRSYPPGYRRYQYGRGFIEGVNFDHYDTAAYRNY